MSNLRLCSNSQVNRYIRTFPSKLKAIFLTLNFRSLAKFLHVQATDKMGFYFMMLPYLLTHTFLKIVFSWRYEIGTSRWWIHSVSTGSLLVWIRQILYGPFRSIIWLWRHHPRRSKVIWMWHALIEISICCILMRSKTIMHGVASKLNLCNFYNIENTSPIVFL